MEEYIKKMYKIMLEGNMNRRSCFVLIYIIINVEPRKMPILVLLLL